MLARPVTRGTGVLVAASAWHTGQGQCAVVNELGSEGLLDWSRVVVDGASVRAKEEAR